MPHRPHLAFILEQTLGHVAHTANLRAALADDPAADISWLPIAYDAQRRLSRLPLPLNWTVTASLMARRGALALDRRRPVDAFFFHTQVTALGALDLMGQRPVVVSLDATPRGIDTMAATYGHRAGGALDGVKHSLTRAVFARATALVAWSAWAKRSLVGDYAIPPDRVTVIPPGTRLDLWATERSPESREGPARVLFVGGDLSRKGGHDLIEACAPLLPDRCELHLVTRATLPARPGVVVHHGIEPNSPALRRLYAEADLFALPTYGDCLPMVIMEAMAAGLPVVATPVAGIPEAVRSDQTGYLVQPGDVADLRAAILALAGDPALRRRLGLAARRAAEERFDARANAGRVRDLLLGLVADAGRRERRPA